MCLNAVVSLTQDKKDSLKGITSVTISKNLNFSTFNVQNCTHGSVVYLKKEKKRACRKTERWMGLLRGRCVLDLITQLNV